MASTDRQTNTHRGYEITSYKARGKYGHYRISKVVRPDGSLVDGLKWNFKFWSVYPKPVSSNIGPGHQYCVDFVKLRINCEVDGIEHPAETRARLKAELDELRDSLGFGPGSKAFEAKHGKVQGVNIIGYR